MQKSVLYARVPPSRVWTHADNACVFALMLMTPKEKTFLQNSEVLLHKYLSSYTYQSYWNRNVLVDLL